MRRFALVSASLTAAAAVGLIGLGAPTASALTTKQAIKIASGRCGSSYDIAEAKASKLLLDDEVWGTLVTLDKLNPDTLEATVCQVVVPASKMDNRLHKVTIKSKVVSSGDGTHTVTHTATRRDGTFTIRIKFGFGADLKSSATSTVPGSDELAKSGIITNEDSD